MRAFQLFAAQLRVWVNENWAAKSWMTADRTVRGQPVMYRNSNVGYLAGFQCFEDAPPYFLRLSSERKWHA